MSVSTFKKVCNFALLFHQLNGKKPHSVAVLSNTWFKQTNIDHKKHIIVVYKIGTHMVIAAGQKGLKGRLLSSSKFSMHLCIWLKI